MSSSGRIELTASDGHRLGAYCAEPGAPSRGGVVVLQEMFGVNNHIRAVCDRLAAAGFTALAPALFDRRKPGFECGYSPEDLRLAAPFIRDPDMGEYLKDTRAAAAALLSRGPVSVLGFSLGGTVAFGAAADIDGLASAVCYYGAHIKYFADQRPKCTTLLHFGAQDEQIPIADIERIRRLRADCTIDVHDGAGHGFHCDERASFHKEAAAAAWERSMAWLGSAQR